MILKERGISSSRNTFKKLWFYFLYLIFVINLLILLGGFLFLKYSPQTTNKIYNVLDNYGISNVKHVPEILSYKLKSYFVQKESININIKHLDVQQLEFMRQNALNGEKKFDFVTASIDHNGIKYKADLKLKGDRDIHYSSLDQASFRVKVKKQKTIFGMNKFSIQKPRARNYLDEWIFLEMMRNEGIVTPRYKFINVSLNGRNQGIYALEEHYTKYLIENNLNKEGPILRFDEATGNFELDSIEVFEIEKWKTEENLPKLKTAIALLDGFRSNRLTIDEVFDTKKLARFFAIADLNYAWHGVITKSMRFYYNPVSMKIEPIPFDGHRGASNKPYLLSAELGITPKNNWTYSKFGNWFRPFFNDHISFSQSFYEEYIRTLQRISKKDYLDNFFEKNSEKIAYNLSLIYSELPLYDNIFYYGPFPYHFDKESYYITQKDIYNKLRPTSLSVSFKNIQQNNVVLEITNKISSLPYEILSIVDEDSKKLCEPLKYSIIYPANSQTYNSNLDEVEFRCFDNKLTEFSRKVSIEVRYPGSDERFNYEIMPKPIVDSSILKEDLVRMKPNVTKFSFVEINEDSKKILIKKGNHIISENMIIPPGYTFIIEKGSTIEFQNNSILLSYSQLSWIGELDERITFNSGEKNNGSIVVMDVPETSFISYVDFTELSYPQIDNWNMSGSINFYKADINLNHINISSNFSEDGINIIKSKLNITNSNFYDIKSDALDVDFGNGNLTDSSFKNIGNDAIDTSGTTLYLDTINISNIGDKGISAGEISSINGKGIEIKNSEIGVTSKDGSSINLSEVNILDSKIALTVFRKKDEYSGAIIEINELTLNNNEINHVIEVNSKSIVNGNLLQGSIKDVDSILYGNLYGKKTQKIEVNDN